MKRQNHSKNDAATVPATPAPGDGGHIDSRPAPKVRRAGLRRYRLRARIAKIYRRNPGLKDTAPATVLDLVDAEYQLTRIWADLEAADERTRPRLWHLWTRTMQMAAGLRQRLNIEAPDDDEDGVDDLEARVEEIDPLFLSHRYGTEWLIRHVRPAERTLWVERYRDEAQFKARYGYRQPPTDWPA